MLRLEAKAQELLLAIKEQDITDPKALGKLLDQALQLIGDRDSELRRVDDLEEDGEEPEGQQELPLASNKGFQIFCDGACSGNPGPGGWGTVIEIGASRQEFSGSKGHTTNNVMELTAAIEGLRRVPPGSSGTVTTDSQYLIKGVTEWLKGWKKRGWKKADGEPVLNRPLWETLDRLTAEREVRWVWVKGHAGHEENERCDELARTAIKGL